MIIASAQMQMASVHASTQHHEVKESLRMWVGDQRPDFEGRGRPPGPPQRESVVISEAGQSAQSSEAEAIEQAAEEAENDPRLMLLRAMLRYLMCEEVVVFNALETRELKPDKPPPEVPQPATAQRRVGWGVEYDRHESYTEREETRFSASGTVQTADGREISFTLQLSMSRSFHEESAVRLRLGDAARQKDPLVLNFGGNAAQLLDQRFSFDLDADGTAENINRLAAGSGFLVFDRNGDRRANDGSELFGPRSGDGFADLEALDDDGNGWIDENDAAWKKLYVWTPDAAGAGELRSLGSAGVGAIALARLDTPFAIRDAENRALGQVRSSSIYLTEDGAAGSIQQVDLSV